MQITTSKKLANNLRKAIWFMAQSCTSDKSQIVEFDEKKLEAVCISKEGLLELLEFEDKLKNKLQNNGSNGHF